MPRRPSCLRLAAALAFLANGAAQAAGGHFDVDDASVLAPGRCQYELWANRAVRADATGLHLGPSCRLGPFEIGIDLERGWLGGDANNTAGPHLKWVYPVSGSLAVGAVAGTAFDLRNTGGAVQAFYLPATWTVTPNWAVNVNLGWDHSNDGSTHRAGASAEWSPNPKTTVIGEHVRTGGASVSRLGVRFLLADGVSVDLSAARVSTREGRLFTVGVNHDFAR